MSEALAGRAILFLVTEDWYFASHRLPIARAARDAGMEVHVATRLARHREAILAEGFTPHALSWRRGETNPARTLAELRELRHLILRVRPDILHAVALKPVVFGAIATMGLPVKPVYAITGLGFAFTERSAKAACIRATLRGAFRLAVDRPDAIVLLQNDDDRDLLSSRGFVRNARMSTIRGSGVDARRFEPLPTPAGNIPTIAVVSRMIAIKGIADLVAASHLLHGGGVAHRLLLVGEPDPDNPSSLSAEVLRIYSRAPWIQWLGACVDVREVWKQAHIAVLTSLGGEGLPKTLLEAASCGRPLVATDVPGSRDVVVDGLTGYLASPGDPDAIAQALRRLIEDPVRREQMGAAARARVEQVFSQERIATQTLELYAEILASNQAPSARERVEGEVRRVVE